MQGWRKNMEDSKITELSVKVGNKNYCVFGVFDGHGGINCVMQELRYPSLLRLTSLSNSKRTKTSRKGTSRLPFNRSFATWM
jgi:hypothetical protein